jgi:tetratricopeptide (TPR) repeat protein
VRRGMGPQPVDPWVKQNYGLRSVWRNNGTNDLMKRLIANGFVPMVTQWMQDPSISRISHWRTLRGYNDTQGAFYVNDSMLGNMIALPYDWFGRNWQSFAYRYMVIYRPEDEPLLRAVIGRDWSDPVMRQALYERAKGEAIAHDTNFAWLAYGEAAYANGLFDEAVAAFERGFSAGSASGVFGLRNSYPQALRALGRRQEADVIAQKLIGITPVPSTVAAAPDSYALFLAIRRSTAFESLPTE